MPTGKSNVKPERVESANADGDHAVPGADPEPRTLFVDPAEAEAAMRAVAPLEQITEQLRRDHRLKAGLEKSIAGMREALDLYGRGTEALARQVLEQMLVESVPIKQQIRALPKGDVRRLVAHAYREHRERELRGLVESGSLSWAAPLPAAERFARGSDERAVELSLAVDILTSRRPRRTLDAGSSLNIPALRPLLERDEICVVHLTQSGDKELDGFDGGRVSYLFGDLRSLPFRDRWFDCVMCISTLEHVGMDNSRYGGQVEADRDSYRDAIDELARVLQVGGALFLTMPAGPAEDRGWYQVFAPEQIDAMAARLGPEFEVSIRYFSYRSGWAESDASTVLTVGSRDGEAVRSIAAVHATRAR
jgi:SAM-dependent methyltransferase